MILMVIFRFGLLLVVFYDDFPFPYCNEINLNSYICIGDPFLRPRDPLGVPRLGNPAVVSQMCLYLCKAHWCKNKKPWKIIMCITSKYQMVL